mmetsp:Transcript_33018/g.66604  ORF Transcript_33018/g.66604 Transcript_33018/m.66604 type:complete len:242 (+) Transcript_33018:927-1652(+)
MTFQQRMTSHKVERLAATRRAEECRVQGLLRFADETRMFTDSAANEDRVAQRREMKEAARAEEERERKRLAEEEAKEKRRNELIAEQNDRLASTISSRNNERERLEREVQRICENSEELKELERSLRVAYINKERAAQHQEAMLLRALEDEREHTMDEIMEQERQRREEEEDKADRERREELVAQKDVLQRQMQENEVSEEGFLRVEIYPMLIHIVAAAVHLFQSLRAFMQINYVSNFRKF